MTVIDVTAAVTAIGGRAAVQDGSVLIEYLYGEDGTPSTRTDGSTALLPHPIRVPIVGGAPVFPVDVPPTDGHCYARITVAAVKPYAPTPLVLPAVAIPAAGPVAISALVAVDPSSYEPTTDVVTAWELAVDQVATMQGDVTAKAAQAADAAADAGTFAGATEFDANRAGQSAFAAGQSAASALGHKNSAKDSADAAGTSAGSASTSAGAAAGSAFAANGSATAASTSATNAKNSETNAKTSETNAAASKTAAETAQSGAQTAKAGADDARTKAEQAAQAGGFVYSASADVSGVLNLSGLDRSTIAHRRLTGNVTDITLPAGPFTGQIITLVLSQDGTGGRTLTVPAAILSTDGMDALLSTAPNAIDLVHIWWDGVRWWHFVGARGGA